MFTSFSATQVWMSGDKSVAKQPSKSERTLLDIRKESAAVRFDWVEGKNLLQSVLVPVSTNSHSRVAAAAAADGSFSQQLSCFLDGFADEKLKSQQVLSAFSNFMHHYQIWPLSERCSETRGKTGVLSFRRKLLHSTLPGMMQKIGSYELLWVKDPSSGGHTSTFPVLEKYFQEPQVENTQDA